MGAICFIEDGFEQGKIRISYILGQGKIYPFLNSLRTAERIQNGEKIGPGNGLITGPNSPLDVRIQCLHGRHYAGIRERRRAVSRKDLLQKFSNAIRGKPYCRRWSCTLDSAYALRIERTHKKQR